MRISPQSRALLDMAAQRRRPARLDGAHDATLPAGQVAGVFGAIGGAVAAEDVRHLQRGSHARPDQLGGVTARLRRSSGLAVSAIRCGGDLRVACRGRQPGVAEQHLDDADVGAGLEQMGGEAVPQGMNGDRLAQLGLPRPPAGRPPAAWRC